MSSKFGAFIFFILFVAFFAFSGSSKIEPDKYGFNINPGDTLGVHVSHNYLIISKPTNSSNKCLQHLFIKTTIADSSMGLLYPPDTIVLHMFNHGLLIRLICCKHISA